MFMTAHEWKHYSGAGTGLRSLLDCYVFCKAKGDSLDLAYIRAQIELLALSEFEQSRRVLAEKIFSSEEMPALTESEEELLNSYLEAGTYGTFENKVKQQLKDKSRFAFWRDSIFISRKEMEHSVPFTAKSPLLYPVGVAWRCGRVLFCKRDRLKQTVQALEKAVKKRSGGKGRT